MSTDEGSMAALAVFQTRALRLGVQDGVRGLDPRSSDAGAVENTRDAVDVGPRWLQAAMFRGPRGAP